LARILFSDLLFSPCLTFAALFDYRWGRNFLLLGAKSRLPRHRSVRSKLDLVNAFNGNGPIPRFFIVSNQRQQPTAQIHCARDPFFRSGFPLQAAAMLTPQSGST
jgi:hypothetical protein